MNRTLYCTCAAENDDDELSAAADSDGGGGDDCAELSKTTKVERTTSRRSFESRAYTDRRHYDGGKRVKRK